LFASLAAALAALGGCVDVNGGAVEVSWSLQRSDGTPNECERAAVGRMSLVATPVPAGDGRESRIYRWPCNRYHGATLFDLAPGRYTLALVPECTQASTPILPNVRIPAPIVRDVREGEVVNLDAFLIVAGSSDLVCDVNTDTVRRLSGTHGHD
jgi:hypothetical protein